MFRMIKDILWKFGENSCTSKIILLIAHELDTKNGEKAWKYHFIIILTKLKTINIYLI